MLRFGFLYLLQRKWINQFNHHAINGYQVMAVTASIIQHSLREWSKTPVSFLEKLIYFQVKKYLTKLFKATVFRMLCHWFKINSRLLQELKVRESLNQRKGASCIKKVCRADLEITYQVTLITITSMHNLGNIWISKNCMKAFRTLLLSQFIS